MNTLLRPCHLNSLQCIPVILFRLLLTFDLDLVLPSCNTTLPILESQLEQILDVITVSWSVKTKETYSSGLLAFHMYCDIHKITDTQQSPISQTLLDTFISSCAGAYSGLAIANFIARLRVWHLLHRLQWYSSTSETHSMIEGTASTKRQKRIPFECNILPYSSLI